MSATIIRIHDPARLRAGMQSVRARAIAVNAPAETLRQALQTLFQEMQAGRSAATSVAKANSSFKK